MRSELIIVTLFSCFLVRVHSLRDDDSRIFVPTVALPESPEDFSILDENIVEIVETDPPLLTASTPKMEDPNDVKFNSSVEPLMLYSTGLSVKGYWMRSKEQFDVVNLSIKPSRPVEPPSITQALAIFFDMLSQPVSFRKADDVVLKSPNTIVGIDMDPSSKEVFWAELGREPGIFSTVIDDEQFEARHRRHFDESKVLVDSGLHSPEDVALDTIGHNLYITDAGLPAIVVCSIRHSHCKIIAKNGLHKPRAIIADSATGWLTYTDWGDRPGLYLVSMDGKRREVLVDTDVVWPNGLAADYDNNQLYWADARLSKIESIDLVTRKRREVVRESAANPFSLSLFEQRIYWSDWSGQSIKTCNKSSGKDVKNVTRAENIYGIHIYHPSMQAPNKYGQPCWSKRCSHMCLLAPKSATFGERRPGVISGECACPEPMILSQNDMSTCREIHSSFLMINSKSYIAQVFPERIGLHTVERIISTKHHMIRDIATDWIRYRLFFFDGSTSRIYSVQLTGMVAKINLLLNTTRSVSSLVYDGWTDNLFWLDRDSGSIYMSPTNDSFELVVRKNLSRPISMVLDKKNRYFYVGLRGKIMRLDASGDHRDDVILVSRDVDTPSFLQLDEQKQRLFWADPQMGTIESISLASRNDDDRIYHRKKLGAVLAIAVYRDRLAWLSKSSEYLSMVKLLDPNIEDRPLIYRLPPSNDGPSDPKRIITVDPIHEFASSACHDHGCSHGCNLDSGRKPSCFCPPGLILENQTTCSRIEPITSTQPPKHIENHEEHHLEMPITRPHDEIRIHDEPEAVIVEEEKHSGNSMIWLIVLLLLLSITGLITLAGIILYKQGKLPRQVSQLTVSFIPQANEKDGAMLLVDEEA